MTLLFGPIIGLLVEVEILSVHVGESDWFPHILAPVRNVAIDDQFGVTLDVEPNDLNTVDWKE
jgi:hypothetical protein